MNQSHRFYSISLVLLFIWSLIGVRGFLNWAATIMVVFVSVFFLVITYRRFKWSEFSYFFIYVHLVLLIVAAHYMPKDEPLFEYLQTTFDLGRNYYDRFTHLISGMTISLVIREFLIREKIVKKKYVIAITLLVNYSIAGIWETMEWIAYSITDTFEMLQLQGDMFDGQKDILMAVAGSIISLFGLKKWHNKSMDKIEPTTQCTLY